MSDKKLTFEEFSEKYFDEGAEHCQCHTTTMPPCGFCEGAYLEDAYEEYLNDFKEEK